MIAVTVGGKLCDDCAENYSYDANESRCVPCNEKTFTYRDVNAGSVWVTGSFTSWATSLYDGAIPMGKDGSGVWSTTVSIAVPGTHQYKFIVNEKYWYADPDNSMIVADGHGGVNSLIEVCEL